MEKQNSAGGLRQGCVFLRQQRTRNLRVTPWAGHAISLWFVFVLFPSLGVAAQGCLRPSSQSSDELSRNASAYLSYIPRGTNTAIVNDEVGKDSVLSSFYEPCSFALAWTSHGKPTAQAEAVVAAFNLAANKGLEAADYAAERWKVRIDDLAKRPGSPQEIADFDLDLTVDLLQYLADLASGRIGSRQKKAPFRSQVDIESLLRIIASDFVSGTDIQRSIESVEPSAEGYRGARAALQHYLDLAKSADISLPRFESAVLPGEDSACIDAVARRLKQLGFLKSDFELKSPTFDGELMSVVRRFQVLHGLGATGILDRETYQELAVPIRRRAEQLALTLERWRWVQHSFPEPPIVINIPEFKLRAFDEQRKVALSMRVIVGKAYRRQTPVFQSAISSIVFHPYWNVPRDIQVGEIAPKVARDSQYLERNGFEVTDSKGDVVHSDSAAVAAGVRDGSLKIRQVPGDRNSLGLIKFVFPNAYGVYLHGTPAQVLFNKARRDFSHGCIRAEDPAALAAWVLRHEQGWSRARIDETLAQSKTVSVTLKPEIPVLIVYGTAVAEPNGDVYFSRDIYGHDEPLERAIERLSMNRLRQHGGE